MAEWQKMREQQKASEQALTDFVVEAVVDGKTDKQIVDAAQFNEKTREFFTVHLYPQHAAQDMVKEIRGYLSSKT